MDSRKRLSRMLNAFGVFVLGAALILSALLWAPRSLRAESVEPAEEGSATVELLEAGPGATEAPETDPEALPVLPHGLDDFNQIVEDEEEEPRSEQEEELESGPRRGLLSSPLASASSTELTDAQRATIKHRIILAAVNLEDSARFPELGLSRSIDSDTLFGLLEEVLQDEPDLFYLSVNLCSRITNGDACVGIGLRYSFPKDDIPAMRDAYEAGMQEMLSWIPDGASDMEKVRAVHDYLRANVAYDYDVRETTVSAMIADGTILPYTPYAALVDRADGSRKAVCQGYAFAFCAAMRRLGIPSVFVKQQVTLSSGASSLHAWNRVCVDGAWYNIDTTWDSVQNSYRYFLKSDAWWVANADSRGFHASWTPSDSPAGTDATYDSYSGTPYAGSASHADVSSFELTDSALVLDYENEYQLGLASVSPEGASTTSAVWASSDPSIVAVDSAGRLYAASVGGVTTISCTINGVTRTCTVRVRAQVDPPTSADFEYDGAEHVGVAAGEGYTLSGIASATNAGTYTVIASLEDPTAYMWSDGTTDDRTITWTIARKPVPKPTAIAGVRYKNADQSAYSAPYLEQYYTIVSGPVVGFDAGMYTTTFRLIDPVNTAWEDGTTDDYALTWEITPAPVTGVTIRGQKTMYVGIPQTLEGVVSPGYAENTSVSWKSSDTSIATVDRNGKVAAKKAGTVTITATSKADSTKSGSLTITVYQGSVSYRTHVQDVGWQAYVKDGAMSGTSGRSLRLEGINIRLANIEGGGIRYCTHIQDVGWQEWKTNGAMSGTSGRSLRLEAIKIELTGRAATLYDVYYRVHAQEFGWMGWAKNGEPAGTANYGYRLEGIQIVLVPKGSAAPSATYQGIKRNTTACFSDRIAPGTLNYTTHVQDVGWQAYVKDGAMSGTSGRSLRLEGICINLSGIEGGVTYRTHVQNIGWQGWRSNNAMSGTSGQSLRLEAIQIKLTGQAAKEYDIYYRVHCENIGWMGWAKNGQSAGSAGFGYRLEGIQIVLVPKGSAAPGANYKGKKADTDQRFVQALSVGSQTSSVSSSYMPPASVVYVTPAGKKYHRDTCVWVQGKRLTKYSSIAAAENAGYKPCNTCYPDGHV